MDDINSRIDSCIITKDKMDKFNQAIEIFKSKYKLNIPCLLKFIKDKIDTSEEIKSDIE